MNYRIERDSLGEIKVASDVYWGAQTQRSLENFTIGEEIMPKSLLYALFLLKKACANVNFTYKKLDSERKNAICVVCDELIAGAYSNQFPLCLWQTGSGTQTNMNVNEVIAHLAEEKCGLNIHPNDHVNRSQSSNDIFPSAIHIACVLSVINKLFPAIDLLMATLQKLSEENQDVVKCGRTHLMDAAPITFGQEVSAWGAMLSETKEMISSTLPFLQKLAIGGTAVGTGLNAPEGFGDEVAKTLSQETGISFQSSDNKFHALSSKDAVVFLSGALKALAANLLKIANDVRWLAAGPRCSLSEIFIPENEPGSSIMPGKVNPTQCEAMTMVAVQVMGNDAAVGIAASQGNFELNVFMPLIAHNILQSITLLSDVITSFNNKCAVGIRANKARMRAYLDNSLMTVTALTPKIGYDNAAVIAKTALKEDISLRDAAIKLNILSGEEFDSLYHPEQMI